ncbi:hypothetical protein XM53_03565 [Roseovarius atlanticus]|uniref:DUF1468 domain-containing protein n=1 Tax=Roseovarius atlanticus TaxID=1641875 RepID=A0A0T5NXM6_9RHOB|nr:tripartite tricarboxylate transporter TctB family protein [Roseovarius atlanticus]KRS13677.1 hypothetical protein XM53_03565 [Roseovarius atlanticus]
MEKRQDIALGLIFVLVGLAAAWMASRYSGASGTYPMTLGLILTFLGGTVAARAVRAGQDKARQLVAAPSKFITTAVIAAVYVAAVIPFGFYTASLMLMLVLPVALGFRQWIYAVIVAVIFIAVVYLVFSVLLEKPLPREAIPPLLGLGG